RWSEVRVSSSMVALFFARTVLHRLPVVFQSTVKTSSMSPMGFRVPTGHPPRTPVLGQLSAWSGRILRELVAMFYSMCGYTREECLMAQGSRWITPAEMEPTQRVWMNFPRAGTVNWPAMWQLSSARRAWTRLAETLNQYVPVTLLVDPDDQQTVTSYVSSD